ncbi:hypothetical protein TGAMA5MH_05005 [Trichoderma gamsii]|uniref:ferric-chelate reductase (NADPH) n=1 Tax=Trichoderma gamsii TaxID=398673 RepID=A0A2K0TC22_9HYPO|nr:hypothetical protein TGAMA5MH_05005 [Trichoderma gamsii]
MTHLFAVAVFMVMFFWHCGYRLTSWDYFIATAAVYVPCYVYPWLRTCFQYGVNSKAQIFVEDSGFIRITIPANFHWVPGQHCFLRFTSFGLLHALSAHPFTICSLPSEKPNEQSELTFFIRPEKGFTAMLYRYALENPGGSAPVLVDGPYGGINMQRYQDSDHLLVVSGGSGAGWCLPLIEKIVRHRMISADEEQGQIARPSGKESPAAEGLGNRSNSRPLSLRVILATRDSSCRAWFLRAVSELLSKHSQADSSFNTDFQVEVCLTDKAIQPVNLEHKPATAPMPKGSLSSTDKNNVEEGGRTINVPEREFEGRPQLPQIVQEASSVAEAGQSLSVFVCGPKTMQNDVRNAVAEENLKILQGSTTGAVYLHTEHFSWA